jgi:hypothetical protein
MEELMIEAVCRHRYCRFWLHDILQPRNVSAFKQYTKKRKKGKTVTQWPNGGVKGRTNENMHIVRGGITV